MDGAVDALDHGGHSGDEAGDWSDDHDDELTRRDQASGTKDGLGLEHEGRLLFVHIDVDAFYCQVEILDDPSLRGLPLVVEQFNSGGFVAVSYEAKAMGVRKGDGVGEGGRQNIAWLIEKGAVSAAEAKRRCPGLVIRPMRTTRYREVSKQLHDLLKEFAPVVEKASYDDFYLEFETPRACAEDHAAALLDKARSLDDDGVSADDMAVHVLMRDGIGATARVRPEKIELKQVVNSSSQLVSIKNAVALSALIKRRVRREMGLVVSIGLGFNKLAARMVSHINKPDGLTVLHPAAQAIFIGDQPLRSIPLLQGKIGREVCERLGISLVEELLQFSSEELARLLPAYSSYAWLPGLLKNLPLGIDPSRVVSMGPQKSIISERSVPPSNIGDLGGLVEELTSQLVPRILTDSQENDHRMPTSSYVAWRCGYRRGGLSSKTAPLSPGILSKMRSLALAGGEEFKDLGEDAAVDAVVRDLARGFHSLFARSLTDVTTVVIGVRYKTPQPAAVLSSQAGSTVLEMLQRVAKKPESMNQSVKPLVECDRCGKRLEEGRLAEHMDWHTAVDLHNAEQSNYVTSGKRSSSNASGGPGKRAKAIGSASIRSFFHSKP